MHSLKLSGLMTGAAVALVISACASQDGIGPSGKLSDPQSIDGGKTLAGSVDVSWPDAQWWKAYGDPQLDHWMAMAMADSPDLAAAAARIRQAAAAAGLAKAAAEPDFNLVASSARERFSQEGILNPFAYQDWWNNAVDVKMSFPLDFWGVDESELEAARAGLRGQTAAARAAVLSLQLNVVKVYLALALQQQRQALLEDDLHIRLQGDDIATQRWKAGLGTELDHVRADAVVSEARARLVAQQRATALLRHQLAALCGQGPGASEQMDKINVEPQQGADLPAHLPAELLGRRPDLVALRWQVEAASHGIDAARGRFYPNLDLSATVGLEALNFNKFLTTDAIGASVGPALTLPIFAGTHLRAQLGSQAAKYDEAVAKYNAALIKALQDAADEVVTLDTLAAQQQQVQAALQAGHRALALAMQGYEAGYGDYLQVLDAQSRLLEERESVATLEYQRMSAHAELMATLGGGYQGELPEAAEPAAKAGPAAAQAVTQEVDDGR